MKKIRIIILLIVTQTNYAQVGIGTVLPSISSILDVNSSDKGLLIPRMTTVMRNSIDSPALSLLIFNTDEGNFNFYNGSILGWQEFATVCKSVSAIGEVATNSKTDIAVTDMSIVPPSAGSYSVLFDSQFSTTKIPNYIPEIPAFVGTAQVKTDIETAYNKLNGMVATNPLHVPAMGSNERLTPGVFYFPGAASIAGTLYLDANNDSDAFFVFIINGAFACGASTIIVLENGAKASNVFWVAEGACSVGAASTMKGTIISQAGAGAIGASGTFEGRLLTIVGALTFGSGTAIIPTTAAPISLVDLGTVAKFVMFTGGGDVSATEPAIITGDIGTNSGTIYGFLPITHIGKKYNQISPNEAAIPGHTIYAPNYIPALASFSIYQNGNLIPSSTKSLTSTDSDSSLFLQTIATVQAGQPIEVKWKTDSQFISIFNRTMSILKVK